VRASPDGRQPEILAIILEMFRNGTSDSSVGRTGDARSFRPDYRPYKISKNCFSYMYLHKKASTRLLIQNIFFIQSFPVGATMRMVFHVRVARDGRQPFQTGLSPLHFSLD
jgi:hypothetical protein